MLQIKPDLQNILGIGDKDPRGRATFGQKIVKRLSKLGWVFHVCVTIPTTLAILYFGLFASDIYISESRFVVKSPDRPSATGLGVLLKSVGFSNASDEINAAQDYIISRDALRALNQGGKYERAYSDYSISFFNRFGTFLTGGSFEGLFKYYKGKVIVDHKASTSITQLSVRAYTAGDAQMFNERLLEMAEATVNRLNVRGRQDLIRFAQAEVNEAKRVAQNAAIALAAFRNRQGLIDPEKQATVQLQMVSKLQDELIATKAQLNQLRQFTPQNPQVEVLSARVGELQQEIDAQIGKAAGDQKSLSTYAVQYQRLMLENQFAERQLASAMASLDEARNEARRKQGYVERIVQPNLPDTALEPRRLRGVMATLVLGLVAWGILSMLLAGIREHQA